MTKNRYTIEITYTTNPALHPVFVSVVQGSEKVYEGAGKNLTPLLNNAKRAILAKEELEGLG